MPNHFSSITVFEETEPTTASLFGPIASRRQSTTKGEYVESVAMAGKGIGCLAEAMGALRVSARVSGRVFHGIRI